MTTVMCAGTFDTIHPGHLHYLSESKKFGDMLVVVVARDETVLKIKGHAPKNDQRKRLENIRSLQIVNKAVLGKPGNIFNIISELQPDVICLGYDQQVQKEELEEELKNRNLRAQVIRMSAHLPHIYKSSKLNQTIKNE